MSVRYIKVIKNNFRDPALDVKYHYVKLTDPNLLSYLIQTSWMYCLGLTQGKRY